MELHRFLRFARYIIIIIIIIISIIIIVIIIITICTLLVGNLVAATGAVSRFAIFLGHRVSKYMIDKYPYQRDHLVGQDRCSLKM